MRTRNSVDWTTLLETNRKVRSIIKNWSVGKVTTDHVESRLAYTNYAGIFRSLVRTNGTLYGRRLARKAISYRSAAV